LTAEKPPDAELRKPEFPDASATIIVEADPPRPKFQLSRQSYPALLTPAMTSITVLCDGNSPLKGLSGPPIHLSNDDLQSV
jgi:hypothetical protein